ncbi:YgcG family protein [Terriglobus sp. RCC_193]|uniref:TPM domain-containing protein n=1 Tax=Terriglobus sp. RCC_193 TaxID=3239218 RepID=UPI0035266BE5
MARRFLRYWGFVVAVALIGWVLPAVAESVKDMPMPTAYVNDYAGVLSDSTKSDLNDQLRALDTQAHAQMFIAVIHKIEGAASPAEFANDLLAKWKPGQKGQDRGVVLVLAVDDHKYQFEIGYGLEGILPDGKTGDIGRDMVPDLKAGNYNGALRTAVGEVSDVIARDAGVTLTTSQPLQTNRRKQRSSGSPISGILIFLAILFFIFLASRGGRGGGGGGRYGGGGGGGFLTGMILGNLLGGGRRGGWGGDDSGWGGGGGGGWGGGGGGFSGGGGGSSGGGGAGGSW